MENLISPRESTPKFTLSNALYVFIFQIISALRKQQLNVRFMLISTESLQMENISAYNEKKMAI